MATCYVARFLRSTTVQSFAALHRRSCATLRPLVTASSNSHFLHLSPRFAARCFSTRRTASSLNDPNPNWSNRPPKETILLDGCDFEHWLVVVEKPEGEPTRDEIIDSYIKTLAAVVGRFDFSFFWIYFCSFLLKKIFGKFEIKFDFLRLRINL